MRTVHSLVEYQCDFYHSLTCHSLVEQRVPIRLLWTSPNVRKTFGDKLVDSILKASPGAVIYGTVSLSFSGLLLTDRYVTFRHTDTRQARHGQVDISSCQRI